MECPTCGLFNPATAQRCDCGFDFVSGTMKVRPDQKVVVSRDWPSPESRLNGVKNLIGQLANLAAKAA